MKRFEFFISLLPLIVVICLVFLLSFLAFAPAPVMVPAPTPTPTPTPNPDTYQLQPVEVGAQGYKTCTERKFFPGRQRHYIVDIMTLHPGAYGLAYSLTGDNRLRTVGPEGLGYYSSKHILVLKNPYQTDLVVCISVYQASNDPDGEGAPAETRTFGGSDALAAFIRDMKPSSYVWPTLTTGQGDYAQCQSELITPLLNGSLGFGYWTCPRLDVYKGTTTTTSISFSRDAFHFQIGGANCQST